MSTVDKVALLERAAAELSGTPRPFLRWAGSKRRLLTAMVPYLPEEFGDYWEPFLGSGALFFLVRPQVAHLSDACEPLIETYRAVRDDPGTVTAAALRWPVNKEAYYAVREAPEACRFQEAGRFIYLNKTCWNGLYRVNLSGKFNVPFGRPRSENVLDSDNLGQCSELLEASARSLVVDDFEDALTGVKEGDFVYLDPPYVTRHNNNGFIDYNERLFTWEDQRRLAAIAARLAAAGAYVMVTNALHDDVLELYPTFEVVAVTRRSTLAGDVSKRTEVSEALLLSYGGNQNGGSRT